MSESLGAFLIQQRKEKGVSVQEISRKTKISVQFLEALEANELEAFPGETYLKGFLRSYAQALDISPELIQEKYKVYKDGLVEHKDVRQAIRDLGERSLDTSLWFSIVRDKKKVLYWMAVPLVACLFAYLVYGFFYSSFIKETFYYTRSFSEAKQVLGLKDNHMYLLGKAMEDVWVSVASDQISEKQVNLKKGEQAVWKAKKNFLLKIGNAGGLELQLNDRPLGVLGKTGTVISALTIDASGTMRVVAAEALTATPTVRDE